MNKVQNKAFIIKLVKTAIVAFILAFLITRFILPTKIIGDSMYPILRPNNYVLVNKKYKSLNIGDIVMFRYDVLNMHLVKRVIAIEGDVLQIKDGEVFVNGDKLEEPYVKEKWYDGSYYGVIPRGCVYVMGDNRNGSIDSRYFGLIKVESITGKILFK